ncbi:MAG: RDD family protein [Acidobacteria bacterium]|nr:RDD family protein [Acidobacteriota bacterium]
MRAPRADGNGHPGAPAQTALEAFALSPPDPARLRAQRPRRVRSRQTLVERWRTFVNGHSVSVPPGASAPVPYARPWEDSPSLQILDLPVVQTAFDFSAADPEALAVPNRLAAPVGVRFRAGCFDALVILLAGSIFFGLFSLLGGQLTLGRRDLLVYLLANFALAALYLGLFTALAGRTPGMQAYGLYAVTFEGQPASRRHLGWRAFGYVVSTGSLLLGFLWALLDEGRLTWHDYISHTFLTDQPV